jgi:ubiquinone/menaquinone biosynthesis C-methylase UbiE
MKINTNSWNIFRYTVYTPGYDILGKIFSTSRKKAIDQLNIQPGDGVLLVGAGTGLDLEFIPAGAQVMATDITPSMIEKVNKRSKKLTIDLEARVMDGQNLDFPDNSFDKILLHLILAVIPDPVACLHEAERVLKPGGKISVFDKFVPANRKVSIFRRILNPVTNLLFSDITRNFEAIASSTKLKIISDKSADFHGNFRILLLEKPSV